MTVEEHIWFYGCLKGMQSEDAKQEMQSMINNIGLPHKRQEFSSKLSGMGFFLLLRIEELFYEGRFLIIKAQG